MALPTAIAFLLVVFGIMACQANHGFLGIITGPNMGGTMARRLLPAAILVPAVLGWLRLEGQRAGLFDTDFGVALHAVTNMLVFGSVVACNAYLLSRTDAQRTRAELRLQRAHDELAVSEGRIQAILDNSTAVVFVKNREAVILINKQFEKLSLLARSRARQVAL